MKSLDVKSFPSHFSAQREKRIFPAKQIDWMTKLIGKLLLNDQTESYAQFSYWGRYYLIIAPICSLRSNVISSFYS